MKRMFSWQMQSLALKQSIITLLVAILVGIFISISLIVWDFINTRQAIYSTGEQLLKIVQKSATQACYTLDSVLAEEILEGLMQFDAVHHAELQTEHAEKLAERQHSAVQHLKNNPISAFLFGDEILFSLPLIHHDKYSQQDEIVGYLKLTFNGGIAGNDFLNRAKAEMLIGCLRSLLLVILLLLVSRHLVTRPLTQMVSVLKQIDPHQTNDFIPYLTVNPLHKQDEIGQLTATINVLFAEVAHRTNQLLESEEYYRLTLVALNDGIWDWNLVSNAVVWNARCYEMLDYPASAFPVSLDVWVSLLHADDLPQTLTFIQQKIKNGEPFHIEFRLRKRTGDWLWVEGRGCVVQWKQGKAIRMIGTHTDISVRKQAEMALRDSESYNKILFADSRIPLIVLEVETEKIIDCNQAAIDIYGFTQRDEVLGKTPLAVSALVQADGVYSADVVHTHLQHCLTHGSHVFEWRHQRPTGELWDAEVYLMLFQHDGKTLVQFSLQDITQRKQTTEALRLSETRYRSIAQNFPNGAVVLFDKNLRYVLADGMGLAEAGLCKVELEGKTPREIFATHLADLLEPLYKRVLQGESIVQETPWNEFVYIASYTPLRDAAGQVINGMVVTQNITQRKKAEQLLEGVLNSAMNGIMAFKSVRNAMGNIIDFEIILANDMAERMIQTNTHSLIGQRLLNIMPHSLVNGLFAKYVAVVETEFLLDKELFFNYLGNYPSWYHLIAVKLSDGFTITFQNINARKQTEETLHKTTRQLESILYYSPTPISILDAQGRYLLINHAMEALWEKTPAQLVNRSVLGMLPPKMSQDFADKINTVIQSKQSLFVEDCLTFSGRERYFATTLFPIETDNESLVGSISLDITENKQVEKVLKQAKEAAENANQTKSAFLASMSHELRTPLNGVLGYAQLLMRDNTLTENQKHFIHIMQKSGEYLLTLVNDVLDLSKIEAGKLELIPTDFCLTDFINEIVMLFSQHLQQKGINFVYQQIPPPTSLPTDKQGTYPMLVHADETRLRQVLLNLLSNATKFTFEGYVSFKTIYHDNNIRFEVEDTGIGIPRDKLESIFMPFEQVRNAQTNNIEGTGLGLSISRKLVEMMGGQLQVQSVVGQGSVFWFEIALTVKEYKQIDNTVPVIQQAIGYTGRRRNILIVDDTNSNREFLVCLLNNLGFNTVEANDGLEALTSVQAHSFDIMLIDLKMPYLDGESCVRQLRRQKNNAGLIIIGLSATVFTDTRENFMAAGCNDFLEKPINVNKLLEKIQFYTQVDWIYDQTHTDKIVSHYYKETATHLLPLADLDELWRLASIGKVKGFLEKAEQLATTYTDASAFLTHLTALARNFELEQLKYLLEEIRNKHKEEKNG
ncbi:PAS domain S-box protein [Beggiatoa leptomitoformis]|uniref:histidine kinase n=1 Tax=Beggiatoa leptomitoformis TaxID=288004 RepID=A0A2N9YBM0_9GAMM|nr:PAS domain S-box protein [Beggiatoa leptomitoformis]AUI67832.1 PAS domain S-box protein [Beggiatoa leptomitoformis]QGX03500.1 PAS domain S-box protein [Beggiatoa leptomitoformis]